MTEGNKEKISLEFFYMLFFYNKSPRPTIIERLKNLKPEKEIIILHSRKEAADFLSSISTY